MDIDKMRAELLNFNLQNPLIHQLKKRQESVKEDTSQASLFTKIPAAHTGITFTNKLSDSPEFNNLLYPFMYNGAGVAIGDIDNNGLPDIFLAGNMVKSRLYLNQGDMKFEDITEKAGITTDKWITGVSMIDINNDGYTDIYLSAVSPENAPSHERANMLFINNGDNTFSERAVEYNIADTSHTVQAVFFDYNKNGLLDLYLLNHSPGSFSRDMADSQQEREVMNTSTSYDRLYRNNGDGTYTDVSREAGILEVTGYGLGVVIADLNNNGWPDIYVSNDIYPNDVLYINNQDGTFTNKAAEYLKHTSHAGMGIDIADFNNDGWKDILQVDMIPLNYHKRKEMSYGVGYEEFRSRVNKGFIHSYTQNTLQMNNGLDDSGNLVFSEIARMSGVAYTDWSWASLFGDYNNSGDKDILVTNGYPKAVHNYDYLIDIYQLGQTSAGGQNWNERYQLFQDLPEIKIPNYLFENKGGITFENVSEQWGFTDAAYSYGAAYADLNNNGSLDLVINNLDATATVYQNNSADLYEHHYLKVELIGPENNKQGIGSEIVLSTKGGKQYLHQFPYRGYLSTVDPRPHFGLGEVDSVDSLEVFWPDGSYELITNLPSNQQISVNHSNATDKEVYPVDTKTDDRVLKEISLDIGLDVEHRQNRYNDFDIQPLLHRQLSMMGPKMAVGDVNGNGLEDLFIGGAADYPAALYFQNEAGNFEKSSQSQPWVADQGFEDREAIFFDANGNGHLDLYVTSGGYMLSPVEDALLDRLYLNRGDGRFIRDVNAIPRMFTSSSVVVPGDFNGNGQMDLFVGGRLAPLKYPYGTRSYILENNNGRFRDVTAEVAPELVEPGMITDAKWVDFDEDGKLDLVTTGEWLPVQFYKNEGNKFREVTDEIVDKPQRGWWYSLNYGDFTGDGSFDIVAGNLGLNDTFSTSEENKFGVFAADFDNNMTVDLVYTVEENEVQYPFFGRAKFDRAMRSVSEKFSDFKSFSEASLPEIFNPDLINDALHYQVDTFASSIFINNGKGEFTVKELPEEAQISPVKEIVIHDVDEDGKLDMILGGNIYEIHPDVARSDAGNGLFLKGDGKGEFLPVPSIQSGLYANKNVKDLKLMDTPNGKILVVANNGDLLQVFSID